MNELYPYAIAIVIILAIVVWFAWASQDDNP